MSVIFGLYNRNGGPVQKQGLERMSRVLAPYGPEKSSIWTKGNIGLGHRLLCFTPEDRFEDQPLRSPNLERVLLFTGRLDNRPDLIRKLSLNPTQASTLPDSRLVFLAYEKWGQKCVHHLLGSFALVLWDPQKKELFLARSPVTARSLFYHKSPRTFAFASMPKALFQLPHIPRELDYEALADYLASAPAGPDKTFYRHIRTLPAGHWMKVKSHDLTLREFWKPDIYSEIRYSKNSDYAEAFNERFQQAVKARFRSITPVGVLMSGGLDSSSVAAAAAPLLQKEGKKLTAFTEVPSPDFKGPIIKSRYADETPYVREIARMYPNIDLNLIRTGSRFYLEDLETFFRAAEIPFRNASNRPYIEAIFKEAQKQNIRVLLTGGQGNLTISWRGSGLLPNLIYKGHWLRALEQARTLSRQGRARAQWRVLTSQGIMPLLPTPLWTVIQSLREKKIPFFSLSPPWSEHSPIRPDFAKENKIKARARRKGHDFKYRITRDTRFIRLKTLKGFGLFDSLQTGYQALFGTETRDPTTDIRVVEFCLSLPEEAYNFNGVSRRLIRRAMKDRLPSSVLWNKKRGLQAADWFERLKGAQDQIRKALKDMEQSDLVCRALDLPRLWELFEKIPHAGSDPKKLMKEYRSVMEFGLMTGSFIRWIEKGI